MPAFDYSRVRVGDKVRDNQSLEEGTIVDMRSLGQWAVVVTVLLLISGVKKEITIAVSAPPSAGALAASSGAEVAEITSSDLSKAGHALIEKSTESISHAQVEAVAKSASGAYSPRTSASANPLDSFKEYIEKSYPYKEINGVPKENITRLIDDLRAAKSDLSIDNPGLFGQVKVSYDGVGDKKTTLYGSRVRTSSAADEAQILERKIRAALTSTNSSSKHDKKTIDAVVDLYNRHEVTSSYVGSINAQLLGHGSDLASALSKPAVDSSRTSTLGWSAEGYTTDTVRKMLADGYSPAEAVGYLDAEASSSIANALRTQGFRREAENAAAVLRTVSLKGNRLVSSSGKGASDIMWALNFAEQYLSVGDEVSEIKAMARLGGDKADIVSRLVSLGKKVGDTT